MFCEIEICLMLHSAVKFSKKYVCLSCMNVENKVSDGCQTCNISCDHTGLL